MFCYNNNSRNWPNRLKVCNAAHFKGAFGRAIFLWQRSIVTETMTKYLHSNTAKKKLLKKLCQRIFVNVSSFVLQAMQKAEGVVASNIFDKCQQTSHFPDRYRETLSNVFGKDLGLHEQV